MNITLQVGPVDSTIQVDTGLASYSTPDYSGVLYDWMYSRFSNIDTHLRTIMRTNVESIVLQR